jgi:hypothetical protein
MRKDAIRYRTSERETHDRRSFVRWGVGRPAKIKLDGAESYANCNIKDINLKGTQIHLKFKLPKDTFLKFKLVLAEDFILNLEGWVVWQKRIEENYIFGLYFTKINDSDKEKIYQFVRRYCANEINRKWWQITPEGGEVMAESTYADRRVFERFGAKFPVRFLIPSTNQEGLAQTRDISAKGLGLVTKEELPPNASLELWLETPDRGEPLYARGEVVWSKCLQINLCHAGINLEKANLMGFSRFLRQV